MAERTYVGSCPVDCGSLAAVVRRLRQALKSRKPTSVVGVNAATVVDANRDMRFRQTLEAIDILAPDGYWIQVAARILGRPKPHHVPIVVLSYRLLEALAEQGGRVYLLGATQATVTAAGAEICRRFPGVQLAGVSHGYFSEADEPRIVEAINQARPEMLLLGISAPKRERFLIRQRSRLRVPLCIGVGGLIDILGGKTKEGPMWLRKYGLMWLYRFLQEPRRLWRRYLITNCRFLAIVFREFTRRRIVRLPDAIPQFRPSEGKRRRRRGHARPTKYKLLITEKRRRD